MKVALFAESFLPHMNGVTHSLLRVLEHLERRGDEALVIAPKAGHVDHGLHGASARYLRSVPMPGYPEVRMTFASAARLTSLMRDFAPDVVHLASPFILGWQGVVAAEALGVPSVAIYQTDVPAYADRYGVRGAAPMLERHLARLHTRATLTLAPSTSAIERLESLGVSGVQRWARGVDTVQFRPDRRSDRRRRELAPGGEAIVGYVGRLAPEKQVADLAAIADLPGVRLVVVGDGPDRADLERVLPGAVFTGFLGGTALAETMAAFDVFVHPGESETFCQTVQEALASGVPVVATGRGGPLDLVESSRTGWLYRPGDLGDLRDRVADLVGDDAKRHAFARAARASVEGRGWDRLGDELVAHYEHVIALKQRSPAVTPLAERLRADASRETSAPRPAWRRYVAVGDSITEGLCDDSRMADGDYRGWADRLAMLLAHGSASGQGIRYANLAVRSRRIDDVVDDQLPTAVALGADLVSVLAGGNDLVKRGADPVALAHRLARAVGVLRSADIDVLVVSAFMPQAPRLAWLRARFETFNAELAPLVRAHGARWLDVSDDASLTGARHWAEDRVHLNSAGHRLLAYAAARELGVPGALELGVLDGLLHEDVDDDRETRLATGRGSPATPCRGSRGASAAAPRATAASPSTRRS
ncbi:glycosyltransferase [Agromyces protaetiae]|uniref:glycosyltransferase n=1 Tax=Agromyces protaetiae TaxID=2509455 RepID=UPI001AA07B2A|nr:glycosyltransferase [Agromyces protaetiae]